MTIQPERKQVPQKDSGTNSFDSLVPPDAEAISKHSNRIVYKSKANVIKTITLKTKDKHQRLIFNTFKASFESAWFDSLQSHSKETYYYVANKFFDWQNTTEYKTTTENKYQILKNFEGYQKNVSGVKSNSLKYIKKTLSQGIDSSSLTKQESDYLKTVINISKPAKAEDAIPYTLSGWFDLPWIREYLGDKKYLQLESPKILITSFRITIAHTLIWLLDQRELWSDCPDTNEIEMKIWYYSWNRKIAGLCGRFDSRGEPIDELSRLILLDITTDTWLDQVKKCISENGAKTLPYRLPKSHRIPWKRPSFFKPENFQSYSEAEEILCAWLLACEAIQPSDIQNLKTDNFSQEKNKQGKTLLLQCTYFKGRSGEYKKTELLNGRDPWTNAISRYIDGLNSNKLFNYDIMNTHKFPLPKERKTVIGFIYLIWKSKEFQEKINIDLRKNNASEIFINAMLALDNATESYSIYRRRRNKTGSYNEYKANTEKPLPNTIFTLTHLKTSAIHSRSDKYRHSDLVNHNSHTSITEASFYLTDKNKDWVNQSGRITRLIINDLQNNTYSPSITNIAESIKSTHLRTKIIEATDSDDIQVMKINTRHPANIEDDEIIIIDNIDTAIYMIHYLNEAEHNIGHLSRLRPEWVEKTLIVNIEWMTGILSRLKSHAQAQDRYENIKEFLPSLFSHMLDTNE